MNSATILRIARKMMALEWRRAKSPRTCDPRVAELENIARECLAKTFEEEQGNGARQGFPEPSAKRLEDERCP